MDLWGIFLVFYFSVHPIYIFYLYIYYGLYNDDLSSSVPHTADSYPGKSHVTFLWMCFHWHISILFTNIYLWKWYCNHDRCIHCCLEYFLWLYVWTEHRYRLSTEDWPLLNLLYPTTVSTSLFIPLHVSLCCTTSLQLTVLSFLCHSLNHLPI